MIKILKKIQPEILERKKHNQLQSYMESLISGIDLGEDRISEIEYKVDELENSNRDTGKRRSNVNSHIILDEKIKYRGYWAKKKNIYLKALKIFSKDSQ